MYAQLAAVSLQRKSSNDGQLTHVFKTLVEASAYLENWTDYSHPSASQCLCSGNAHVGDGKQEDDNMRSGLICQGKRTLSSWQI